MPSRRDLLQVLAATGAALGPLASLRAAAQQRARQDDLLAFPALGNVTLVHVTDLHGQMIPVHFREPAVNIGVGDARGVEPFLTGDALLARYNIAPGSLDAYMLSDRDFGALARIYGRVGGLDRIATVIESIRAERGSNMLLLDGGDTWTNSYVSSFNRGQDMVGCMRLLKPDAMTAHWEFTLGAERVLELKEQLDDTAFLCQNVRENEFEDPVFDARTTFERGGVKISVIGQAMPTTPIANPRWMIPKWTFGIRERELQAQVNEAREEGAELVVLLSHNGFAVDRKLASRVRGIDVILTAHTHDALPEPVRIGRTLLVASGSHGKFVSRLDLDVRGGEVRDARYRLIPILADVITPHSAMTAEIADWRAPHSLMLAEVVGRSESTLYRRGTFNGTFDDLICDAMLAERDAEIALSPGFRWGASVLAGDVTREDVHNATQITYPQTYRAVMSGQRLKDVLEDVADNIFNPDPYLQGGGDMVRVGGMTYAIDVTQPIGRRISDMRFVRDGRPIDPARDYVVAGWASVNENVDGPAISDVVFDHLKKNPTIVPRERNTVRVIGT